MIRNRISGEFCVLTSRKMLWLCSVKSHRRPCLSQWCSFFCYQYSHFVTKTTRNYFFVPEMFFRQITMQPGKNKKKMHAEMQGLRKVSHCWPQLNGNSIREIWREMQTEKTSEVTMVQFLKRTDEEKWAKNWLWKLWIFLCSLHLLRFEWHAANSEIFNAHYVVNMKASTL